MPRLPERRHSRKDRRDGPSNRPYTAMALSGLEAGLSWRDMRHMKYTHLMQLLYEWEDMHGADVEEVVDATPADVKALMSI